MIIEGQFNSYFSLKLYIVTPYLNRLGSREGLLHMFLRRTNKNYL